MTVDRKTPPPIHDAVTFDFKLPPLNHETLDNGLPLYWLNAGVQDVVEIDWVFPAGLWHEPSASVAHAVAGMLKNGTSSHTAAQISEALEFYGAQLKAGAGNDFSTLSLYTLTKHLPALLPMVYEIITDAIFPEAELELYKRNAVQKLLVNLRQCDFVANQQIDSFLFGPEHPYGRYTRREKIEYLQQEQLVAFYKSHYNLANAKIFMGGKAGPKEVALINQIFGKALPAKNPIARQECALAPHPEKVHRIINDPNSVQGAIRIGRTFPNRHHPDYTPFVVLNTLFGGYFGSRLMSNIREDKGYTYGIYSALSSELSGGSFVIQSETGRDVAEAAVVEVYKEMDLLCQEPVDEEELLLVKNYLLGGLIADLDGPFSILQRWRMLILNGFPEAYFDNNIHIYKTVTPAELQALAQKYFGRQDYHELIVV